MKILVLVKEVPDTWGERLLNLETGLLDRDASERVLDEVVERALEVALSYADDHPGTHITTLSMASDASVNAIRKGLALGADRAILVSDSELVGADVMLTATVLAAAVAREEFDLIICGNRSTDGSSGMVPALIAELLNLAALTNLDEIEISESSVRGKRRTSSKVLELQASYPALISITERTPEARFPSFKGIMSAKKKSIEVFSLADLGLSVDVDSTPRTIMIEIARRPARGAGVKIMDDGSAGQKLARYLAENRLV